MPPRRPGQMARKVNKTRKQPQDGAATSSRATSHDHRIESSFMGRLLSGQPPPEDISDDEGDLFPLPSTLRPTNRTGIPPKLRPSPVQPNLGSDNDSVWDLPVSTAPSRNPTQSKPDAFKTRGAKDGPGHTTALRVAEVSGEKTSKNHDRLPESRKTLSHDPNQDEDTLRVLEDATGDTPTLGLAESIGHSSPGSLLHPDWAISPGTSQWSIEELQLEEPTPLPAMTNPEPTSRSGTMNPLSEHDENLQATLPLSGRGPQLDCVAVSETASDHCRSIDEAGHQPSSAELLSPRLAPAPRSCPDAGIPLSLSKRTLHDPKGRTSKSSPAKRKQKDQAETTSGVDQHENCAGRAPSEGSEWLPPPSKKSKRSKNQTQLPLPLPDSVGPSAEAGLISRKVAEKVKRPLKIPKKPIILDHAEEDAACSKRTAELLCRASPLGPRETNKPEGSIRALHRLYDENLGYGSQGEAISPQIIAIDNTVEPDDLGLFPSVHHVLSVVSQSEVWFSSTAGNSPRSHRHHSAVPERLTVQEYAHGLGAQGRQEHIVPRTPAPTKKQGVQHQGRNAGEIPHVISVSSDSSSTSDSSLRFAGFQKPSSSVPIPPAPRAVKTLVLSTIEKSAKAAHIVERSDSLVFSEALPSPTKQRTSYGVKKVDGRTQKAVKLGKRAGAVEVGERVGERSRMQGTVDSGERMGERSKYFNQQSHHMAPPPTPGASSDNLLPLNRLQSLRPRKNDGMTDMTQHSGDRERGLHEKDSASSAMGEELKHSLLLILDKVVDYVTSKAKTRPIVDEYRRNGGALLDRLAAIHAKERSDFMTAYEKNCRQRQNWTQRGSETVALAAEALTARASELDVWRANARKRHKQVLADAAGIEDAIRAGQNPVRVIGLCMRAFDGRD